ncbi:MAG: hypothetical protein LBD47_11510 [Treponema sp.]|jgi:CheY-like chemotaxis protein|nr:hypothetical protein [Treponema sp.]
MVFFILIYSFFYNEYYRPAITSTVNLANYFFSMAKIESGKMEIVSVHYYFRPIINGVINILRIRAREKEKALQSPRDISASRRPPVVTLTANVISGMKEMFPLPGFDDYPAKPIELIKLHEILEKRIPRERQIREKRRPELNTKGHAGIFDGKTVRAMDLAAGMKRYADDSADLVNWLRGQLNNIEYDAIRERLEKEIYG